MSTKPSVVGVEFSTDDYTPTMAEKFLAVKGYNFCTERTELPGLLVFGRAGYEPIPGSQKSLAKGVKALLGRKKAYGDEDEEDKEKIDGVEEKAEDNVIEEEPAEEIETPEEEAVEPEAEETAETEAAPDAAAQAQDVADLIAHCEAAVESFESMAIKDHPELGGKIQAFVEACNSIAQELRADFGTHFGEVALETMMNRDAAPVEDVAPPPMEDVPAEEPAMDLPAEDMPEIDDEEVIKSINAARRSIQPVVKGMPRLRKAFTGVA